MGQKFTIKVIFNSTKDSWESFGNNRYLLKLSYPEDSDAGKIIIEYISRQIGVPASRITYLEKDIRNNWLFEVL